MRFVPLACVVIAGAMSVSPARAQEYVEFKSMQDHFGASFPTQPKITESTYKTQSGSVLPARIYTSDSATSHFKVTVVDYSNIQAIGTEKAKKCPPGSEACSGNTAPTSSTGAGYWKVDLAGALDDAAWQLMQRDAKVTYFGWNNIDFVEGTMISLQNRDRSRTSAALYMHENKLFIIEGTVPAGFPVPDFFQQSVQWLNDEGNPIRYATLYHNGFPRPPIGRQGQAAAPAAAAPAR